MEKISSQRKSGSGLGDGMLPDFESFYQLNYSRLRNFLHRYLGDAREAEDIAQDAFLQLWRNRDGYKPDRGTLKAYLFGIAAKRAADCIRRDSKTKAIPSMNSVDVPVSSTVVMADALDQLPPEMRALIWLREVEGYRHGELAAIFGIPEGTVKSRLHAAREQLRRVWHMDGG